MSHTDLSIPNLKKLKKALDTMPCKITTPPPSFSVPDRLSHLLNFKFLLTGTFHCTTGQVNRPSRLQTFAKLNKVDIQATRLRQVKRTPSEIIK